MPSAMRVSFAAALLVAASAATSASAGNVSGTISGEVGSDGSSSVHGTLVLGTGASPDDDPTAALPRSGTDGSGLISWPDAASTLPPAAGDPIAEDGSAAHKPRNAEGTGPDGQ